MPTRNLRKHLFKRLSNELRAAGELGLAFVMTAGVASCGGKTVATGASGDAGTHKDSSIAPVEGGVSIDGPADAGFGSEGTGTFDGAIVEAAFVEGGVIIDGPPPPESDARFDSGPAIDGLAVPEGGIAVDGPANPDSGH